MTMQQEYPRRGFTLQIDFDQAVWQSYLNCVNSFAMAETLAEKGAMAAIVTESRFNYNVQVIDGMIHGWKDEEFNKVTKGWRYSEHPFEYWREINSLLVRQGFFKRKHLTGEI